MLHLCILFHKEVGVSVGRAKLNAEHRREYSMSYMDRYTSVDGEVTHSTYCFHILNQVN